MTREAVSRALAVSRGPLPQRALSDGSVGAGRSLRDRRREFSTRELRGDYRAPGLEKWISPRSGPVQMPHPRANP